MLALREATVCAASTDSRPAAVSANFTRDQRLESSASFTAATELPSTRATISIHLMSYLTHNQLSSDTIMGDESTASSSFNPHSFAASKFELICLPDDLSTLDHASAQPERATSAADIQVPSALAHPAVLFDVLSASNIEALIESLEPLEQHALLVRSASDIHILHTQSVPSRSIFIRTCTMPPPQKCDLNNLMADRNCCRASPNQNSKFSACRA